MKRLKFILLATPFLFAACGDSTSTTDEDEQLATVEDGEPKESVFPDFGYMVSPEEYRAKYSDQPVFRIKTDFPTELPKELPDFLKIDFMKDPLKYIEAVRDYGFEGNIPSWDPYLNTKANWYHIPWLHPSVEGANAYPPNGGTEGFHGLIKEAPVGPYQLGPDQKGIDGDYSVYAITLINDFAGHAMGRMWKDPNDPNLEALDKRYKDGGFPEGTVFMKLLFTDAPKGKDQVEYLVNPLTWTAYITENFWKSDKRVVSEVHLLQMDISVRDPRADRSKSNPEGTGWVFGTFCYNGKLNNKNKFMNLVPVGLTWGNDPENKVNKTSPYPVTSTFINKDLKQTIIFESKDLPPQHLGWNGRLNGPADLNTVSCMSCHNAAQYPAYTSLVPEGAAPDGGPNPPAQGGSVEWMKWFQNLECGTTMNQKEIQRDFNENVYSTDFSFQVAIALENFFTAQMASSKGLWASQYDKKSLKSGNRSPQGSGLQKVPIRRGDVAPN